jgi:hypothetical protein
MDKLPVSLGILSYKGPKTVDASLKSYAQAGFLDLFQEAKVFFQSYTEDDKRIADQNGIEHVGRSDNVGIQYGMRWVVENLTSKYILYVDMDNPLIVSVEKARAELEKGLELLKSFQVQVLRYRSRFYPGEQFSDVRKYTTVYTPEEVDPRFSPTDEVFISDCSASSRFFKRTLRPFYARKMIGRSMYVEKNAELRFPGYIQKTDTDVYIVDSAVINWTSQCILTPKKFFLDILDWGDAHLPSKKRFNHGFPTLEPQLNGSWWRNQHFKIGVTEGIFTHRRIDR